MSLLQNEPNGLGGNLLWRAMPADIAHALLWMVVGVQALIGLYLWKAAISFACGVFSSDASALDRARTTAVYALTCFMCLWLFFMVGGFWFGYWIKQGPIQQVHMTLLILSILALKFISNRRIEENGLKDLA